MELSFNDFIEEILRDCKKRKIRIQSADFIAFLVSITSLSFSYQTGNRKNPISDEKKIHNTIIEKLLNHSAPSLLTLKIQFYFSEHYYHRENIIKKHRTRLRRKMMPLIREICEIQKLNNTRDIEKLYQKMLVVATISSGLGNPRIPLVLREVAIALQSVLQPSELPHYVSLSVQEKEEQLMELVFIVAGIRLFNRDCQRGGEDIDDQILMDKIYKFTAIIEFSIYNQDESGRDSKDIEWSIEMLVASRQHEIYLRQLLADVQVCGEKIRSLTYLLKNLLFRLHKTVKYKTAVPTIQVYPQFKSIAEIWLKLQDEVIALNHINEMLWQLEYFFPKTVDPARLLVLNNILKKLKVLTDTERLEKTMRKLIVDCGDCSLAYPSNDTNFYGMNMEFLGFCIWSFVVGNGALIPGNPNIGVAEWRSKFFAFCSVDAAKQFGENPDRFLHLASNIVQSHQEYIHFFQLFNVTQVMIREKRSSKEYWRGLPLKISQNQEIQTELHVVPTFIDMNYLPSVWAHRQKAVQFRFRKGSKMCETVFSIFQFLRLVGTAGFVLARSVFFTILARWRRVYWIRTTPQNFLSDMVKKLY